jgi:hypothetical protein
MTAQRKALEARRILDGAVTEADLQEAVIELAQLRGYLVHHCRPGATTEGRWATQIQGDPGFPDLVLARARPGKPGELLFVELKRQEANPTEPQQRWLGTLADIFFGLPLFSDRIIAGVVIWRPSDWSSGEIERRLA